jgi:hypothetical protein
VFFLSGHVCLRKRLREAKCITGWLTNRKQPVDEIKATARIDPTISRVALPKTRLQPVQERHSEGSYPARGPLPRGIDGKNFLRSSKELPECEGKLFYALRVAPLHGFLLFPPKHCVLWQSGPPVQMDVVARNPGGKLSTHDLERSYIAALSKIAAAPKAGADKKRSPIYQRESTTTERESIQDAANALAALWKIGKP